MDNEVELQQMIYDILLAQIQFGTYRFGEHLPAMRCAGDQLLVSIDTMRSAYHRLRQEGYISLSRNVGATVQKQYSESDCIRHIQQFFAARKSAAVDLSKSMRILFGQAQWLGLKYAQPEAFKNLEALIGNEMPPPYLVIQQLKLKYSPLGNDILLRLAWKSYMFAHAPFFCIAENVHYLDSARQYWPDILSACRSREWASLRNILDEFQDAICRAIDHFYESKITLRPPAQETAFDWRPYKKASQRCYSLAMDLLLKINSGEYPPDSLLPPLEQISAQNGCSLHTARRALGLLRDIGAVKPTQRIGTQILSARQDSARFNFTQPAAQKCLLRCVQSMQIAALSIRAAAESTLLSLDPYGENEWKSLLFDAIRTGQCELCLFGSITFIAGHAPLFAVRTVYRELRLLLLWGYPLRRLREKHTPLSEQYLPAVKDLMRCLEQSDAAGFSAKLEELFTEELRLNLDLLLDLGIQEAGSILIPESSSLSI